jgi:HEAT repeats
MTQSGASVDVGATAQDAYQRMLGEHVAPALRELGFRGAPSRGNFRLETATHAAEVRFQKSRYSSKQEVDFWVLLRAVDINTEWLYWDWTLASLAGEWGDRGDWAIRAGDPVEPVASEVVHSLRTHAWPAIQAALDNPGYPRDPTVQWPRTFPKIPIGPRFDDEVAAERRSREELEEIMVRAGTDPRAFQALLARLETDPDPGIRRGAAWYLLRRAHEARSRQALRAAAAEDEDVEVRWVARWALRLAQRGTFWMPPDRISAHPAPSDTRIAPC